MTDTEAKRKTQLDSGHVVVTAIPEDGESSMDPCDTSVASAKCIIEQVTIMFSGSQFDRGHRSSLVLHLAVFSISAAIALALISDGVTRAFAQNNNPQRQSERASGGPEVARGKYVVEGVAMCGECHTPRDSNGNLDQTRWLQGAPVPYLSAKHDSNWPLDAPRIGGIPPASDADMIRLLTTGIWTTGNRLRLPMPQFRMDRSDAEAVVAYLKSLTPQQ
jgi:mono/diheme cytochrome c family protein